MPGKPFSLTVRAVILDSGSRCLLVRRSRQNLNFAGRWEWPGGKVKPGESFSDALVREIYEEISLTVEITGLAGATQFEMPAVNVVLLCMEARVIAGEIKLSAEHDDFAWVPFQEFHQRDLPEREKQFMLNYAAQNTIPKPLTEPIGPVR